ncbi:hypothetical protein AAFC00_007193 [Neodothiora populina]|uniref:YCII-related domain-containing protein n=1 Tax=Neodothiora populina TaxID=2781224 RepID=A0ABR3PHU7_9PEZI
MAQKHEWIVILPDNTDALEKRMSVRQSHLSNLTPDVESGLWLMGGATLDEPPKEGEGPKINGSIMLALAETKEEVLEKLKGDVYSQSGVWNWEKVQIYPFKAAFRKAL